MKTASLYIHTRQQPLHSTTAQSFFSPLLPLLISNRNWLPLTLLLTTGNRSYQLPTNKNEKEKITFNSFFFFSQQNVLTEASEQLYNVSRGRLQWDRITFLLPRNYSADCAFMSQPRRVVRNRRADGHQADLIVGDSHPLLGDLPWAEQFYGGCGVAGRGVRLSRSFLASAHRQNNTLFLQGL